MSKVHLCLVLTLSVLLVSCAQPPFGNTKALTAEAARFGVSRHFLLSAESAGYSPRIRHGKTAFCTHRSTFSYIPRLQCFGTSALEGRLQQQARFRRSVRNAVRSSPTSSSTG